MTIWRPDIDGQEGPRYLAIADALARAIDRGDLAPGDRLPTHRDLAGELGLTVGTVSRAYAEAERRGLLHGEVGRGTFVADPGQARDGEPEGAAARSVIDLGLNLPLYTEDPDLSAALAELARRRDLGAMLNYQPFTGETRYREAGARWIARHRLDVPTDRVIVTAGAQHAIAVALGALCRPGDIVLGEELTYPGLKTAASLLGLEVMPVAMDRDGLDPDDLERAARETGARVLYTMPTLHNPTTVTMPAERRRQIVDVAERCDLMLVEDDVHGLLATDAPPPLASLAPERTLYVTSTSKTLAGGLRVAFVAAPAPYIDRLTFAVAASLWALPALSLEVAAMWIADGTAVEVTGRKCDEATERQHLARSILSEARYREADRSYFVWLELPAPWTTESFVRAARELGVVVSPADAFAAGRREPPPAVRVSLSSPRSRDELAAGLRTLAGLLERGPAPAPTIV
ncbi:aminotransferase class I/II-fold pyridoxal phosphate-dependent enzyme [bacterium]|nr:aminotransferase class I/II-fold pyridoxal phosphate-dependent enzyme [bacterium]